ncbi:hypothetical protein GQ600_13948 [Phytophthora cactorum]|nr:hypothetical protein GQ600_13948 [Phytophthora cactorum]
MLLKVCHEVNHDQRHPRQYIEAARHLVLLLSTMRFPPTISRRSSKSRKHSRSRSSVPLRTTPPQSEIDRGCRSNNTNWNCIDMIDIGTQKIYAKLSMEAGALSTTS